MLHTQYIYLCYKDRNVFEWQFWSNKSDINKKNIFQNDIKITIKVSLFDVFEILTLRSFITINNKHNKRSGKIYVEMKSWARSYTAQ